MSLSSTVLPVFLWARPINNTYMYRQLLSVSPIYIMVSSSFLIRRSLQLTIIQGLACVHPLESEQCPLMESLPLRSRLTLYKTNKQYGLDLLPRHLRGAQVIQANKIGLINLSWHMGLHQHCWGHLLNLIYHQSMVYNTVYRGYRFPYTN